MTSHSSSPASRGGRGSGAVDSRAALRQIVALFFFPVAFFVAGLHGAFADGVERLSSADAVTVSEK